MLHLQLGLLLLLFISSSSGEEGPIRIGTTLPLSGHTANFGIETLRGINVAVQTINEQGGIKGRQLDLVVRDNAGNPTQTAQEVTNLINSHQVRAIIGPTTSTNTAAAAAVNFKVDNLLTGITLAAGTKIFAGHGRYFNSMQISTGQLSYVNVRND